MCTCILNACTGTQKPTHAHTRTHIDTTRDSITERTQTKRVCVWFSTTTTLANYICMYRATLQTVYVYIDRILSILTCFFHVVFTRSLLCSLWWTHFILTLQFSLTLWSSHLAIFSIYIFAKHKRKKKVNCKSNSICMKWFNKIMYTNYIKYPVDDFFWWKLSIVSFQEKTEIAWLSHSKKI